VLVALCFGFAAGPSFAHASSHWVETVGSGACDREGSVLHAKGAPRDEWCDAYRKDGELLSASNASASVRFERDALGRIVKETQGKHSVESEYDLLGLRTAMQSTLGAKVAIDRNAMGDVTGVQGGGFEAKLERDLLGLELLRELPGGVQSRWRRDSLGRPVQHDITASGTLLRARSYHWDTSDRLRMIVDAQQGPVQYQHDAVGNLAAATYADGTHELRLPDAVGNLFKQSDRKDRTYGAAGQLLESTDARGRVTRYAYDAEGNLVEKREGSGRLWQYRWGADGMLAEVTRPDGAVVRFEYDALGRRVAKHYRGQMTRFVWDGNVPLHEWVEGELEQENVSEAVPLWAADADVKKREAELSKHLTRGPPQRGSAEQPITWLFEPESFSPMAKLGADGTKSIICDHLGTPVAMVDDAGTRVWSADVSVYGELRGLEGERYACPFRWPGQYEDAETGLYYNRFRYYDPESGQYASQDPIRLEGGLRVQQYPGDPLTAPDVFGLAMFRGARPGESPSFSPKPGEFKIDNDTGLVKNTHGVSVFDNAESVSSKGFVPHEVDLSTVPESLKIEQRGKDPKHFEIMPKEPMTSDAFKSDQAKIRVIPTHCG